MTRRYSGDSGGGVSGEGGLVWLHLSPLSSGVLGKDAAGLDSTGRCRTRGGVRGVSVGSEHRERCEVLRSLPPPAPIP